MHAMKHLELDARSNAIAQRSGARANSAARANGAGFTLIELMVVVAIMGVLATLAVYGVRKYVLEAKRSEAVSMLTQIRSAEEAYRDETFAYLGGTAFDAWHPSDDPGGKKTAWLPGTGNAMSNVFDRLGVVADGPVEYTYAVVAGTVGIDVPALPNGVTFPTPTGPYYVAIARADLNNDGAFTYAFCHSDTNAISLDDNY